LKGEGIYAVAFKGFRYFNSKCCASKRPERGKGNRTFSNGGTGQKRPSSGSPYVEVGHRESGLRQEQVTKSPLIDRNVDVHTDPGPGVQKKTFREAWTRGIGGTE